MYTWHKLEEVQFKGELSKVGVQFMYMMVLLLVMLKGKLLLSWMPWDIRSDVMQVLGKKLEGLITSRWIEGLMAVMG